MTRRYRPEIHELSMEEADKRMDSAGEIPFSPEEIDAMVRSATTGLHIPSGILPPPRSPDMRDETDEFWEELLNKLSDADSLPDLTLEEAEERMATAGEAPFSDDEIAAIVRSATTGEPASGSSEEPTPKLRVLEPEPELSPTRKSFFLRYSKALSGVAALFLGIMMLYSVTSRTFHAGRRSADPGWSAAVETMLDPGADEEQRTVAQRRVYLAARNDIRTLRRVVAAGGELRPHAEAHASELRQLLESTESGSTYASAQSVDTLRDKILDQTYSLDERLDWLSAIRDHGRNSILVLIGLQTETQPGSTLNESASGALDLLASELRR